MLCGCTRCQHDWDSQIRYFAYIRIQYRQRELIRKSIIKNKLRMTRATVIIRDGSLLEIYDVIKLVFLERYVENQHSAFSFSPKILKGHSSRWMRYKIN